MEPAPKLLESGDPVPGDPVGRMLCRRALPAGVERKAEGVCGLGGWGDFMAADLNVGVEGVVPPVDGEGAALVFGEERTGL